MTRIGTICATVLLTCLGLLGCAAQAPAVIGAPTEEQVMQLANSNNDFALRLYRQLAGGEGNLFLSPHSISTALAMTWAGARGETEREMAETLGFTMGQDRTHAAFAAQVDGLEQARQKSGVKLHTANGLWPQQGFPIAKPFLKTVKTGYQAELRPLDFEGATEDARQTINRWVEDKTENRIRELIKPGVLNNYTRLVLTNAIYFKGQWKKTFDEKLTREQPFTLASGKQVDLPLMYIEFGFRYGQVDDLQLLRLSYGKDGISMVILLPASPEGLPALERRLDATRLGTWLDTMQTTKVKVYLPRFKVESEFQLNRALSALGMKTAFKPGADFTGMDPQNRLHLSAVVHKAFVEVNEEGTEAAAATAGMIATTGYNPSKPPTPVFRADHPFIYMIMGPEDEILFIGRMADPR